MGFKVHLTDVCLPLPGMGNIYFLFLGEGEHFLCIPSLYAAYIVPTLESGIDVGQGITIGPGKFVKKNKPRALNEHRAWKNVQIYVIKKSIKLENICRPWEKF